MLLRSPIAQAARVRQGQTGCRVPGAGCRAPTASCATGADAGAAVRGCPGPARQPHASVGAVPGAAGQGGTGAVSGVQGGGSREGTPGCRPSIPPSHPAPQAAVVPGGRPRAGRRGDGGRRLRELRPLAPPAPGAAPEGQDRPAQPLVPTVARRLCWPWGDRWPWGPHQEQRRMERT